MSLIQKIPIEDMIKLRKMPRDEALEYIKRFNLDSEEISTAERLFLPVKKDPHRDNRLWLAAAHLLGASYKLLGRDRGTSAQSVFNQVERMIPNNRAAQRLGTGMSLEVMSTYKVKYFENVDALRELTPQEIASWLLVNTELDQ